MSTARAIPGFAFVTAAMLFAAAAAPAPLASAQEQAQSQAQDPTAPSTKKMAAILEECARKADPETCAYLNAQRAQMQREKLDKIGKGGGKAHVADLRLKLALETLQSGDPEGALVEIDRAIEAAKSGESLRADDVAAAAERLKAITWLRLGEVENCLGGHCCQSCIAPIEGGGTHVKRRGSENAIPILMDMLRRDPDDREARWLLNLAHMTLGNWPAGVPKELLVPPERFASEHELPRFRDVAVECGLGIPTTSGGICAEDFDKDGYLDVLVSSIGLRDPMHFFRANGDGTFTERTAEAGLTGLVGGLNMIHGDYDNDGWVDVFVLRGAWFDDAGEIPDSLLRNRGDGTFEDVTEQAGLQSFHPSQAGAFADFDGDGWLDVVIGNETQQRKRPHPGELYRNNRDGTFTNVAVATGADVVAFTKAVAVGDYDDDGRPDVYYSRRGQSNLLKRNVPDDTPGGPGFKLVDVAREAGVGMPVMSFPSWWFDYDNDGRLDLFVAANAGFGVRTSDGIGDFMLGNLDGLELPRLYRNEGGGRFTDVSQQTRVDRAILSMGSNYGDLDNDGWLDFVLGTGAPSFAALIPNKAFRNDRGQVFQDVTTSAGLGHLQKGHGVALADFDNDGDQDVFVEIGGAYEGDFYPNALFENPGNANRWITLRLEGVKANKSAIGARLRVDVATPAGSRSIHLVVGTGGSFGSSSLQQEIGLGDATAIDQVFIRWPGSETRQTIAGKGVALDRAYRIVEGRDGLEPVEQKKIRLGAGPRDR